MPFRISQKIPSVFFMTFFLAILLKFLPEVLPNLSGIFFKDSSNSFRDFCMKPIQVSWIPAESFFYMDLAFLTKVPEFLVKFLQQFLLRCKKKILWFSQGLSRVSTRSQNISQKLSRDFSKISRTSNINCSRYSPRFFFLHVFRRSSRNFFRRLFRHFSLTFLRNFSYNL